MLIGLFSTGAVACAIAQQRTAAITLIASILFLLFLLKKLYWYRVMTAITFVFLLFLFKQNSTQGRAFILTRSLSVINQHPFGVGTGNFHSAFSKEQRSYFKTHDLNNKTALLAGNTYFAFNEYLQITVERGIFIGILFLLLVSGTILMGVRQYRKDVQILPFLLCFYSISVASLFFYLLHNWFILFLFGFSVWGIYSASFLKKRVYYVSLLVVACIAGSFLLRSYQNENRFKQRLNEAERMSFSGYIFSADSLYSAIPGRERHTSEFLSAYTIHCFNAERYDTALLHATRAVEINPRHDLFLLLGDIYMKLGKVTKAESAYKEAVYAMPSKFYSRKKLADFYNITGNKVEEKSWLNLIINLPIKVHSPEAEKIKLEASSRLLIL